MNYKQSFRWLTTAFFLAFLNSQELLSWTTPVQISNGGFNVNPSMVVNNAGNAVAAWTQGTYPALNIEASIFTAGVWSSPTTVNIDGINDGVSVGIDSSGNTVAVWENLEGETRLVMAAVKPVASPWSVPIVLSNSDINFFPHVAMNANGQAVVAWDDNTNQLIKASILTFGGSWSAPIILTPTGGGRKGNTGVGIDSNGNAFVVWEEVDTGEIALSQTVGGFGLTWSAPLILSPFGINIDPAIGVSATGNAVVSWTLLGSNQIRAVTYTAGSWNLNSVVLSTDPSQKSSAVRFAADGFATFHNDLTGQIQASNFNGGIWDPAVNISITNNNQIPVISVDSVGTAYIAWPDSGTGEIKAVQFPNGGSPDVPQVISGGDVNFDVILSSGATNTIAIWETYIGTDLVIQANVD